MPHVLKEPAAIVAKAECQIEAVSKVARAVKGDYLAALKLREDTNKKGLEIGRRILEACFDAELTTFLKARNAKEAMPAGGQPVKAHAYVAREIARVNGFNEEYLTRCARTYLNAANKVLAAQGKPVMAYDRGVFLLKYEYPLPEVSAVQQYLEAREPRIDELPEEVEGENPQATKLDVSTWAKSMAEITYRKLHSSDINLKSNKAARNALVRAFNAALADDHFSIIDETASRRD
jgi:hypothetical protein